MLVAEIPLSQIDVSNLNVPKNLDDSDSDGGIADLANAIERQSLLSPITVYKTPEDRYAVIAGQRRLLAVRQLQLATIPAIVREAMNDGKATAVSLIENVHRADMNPRDKAVAFRALLNRYGSIHQVSKETGVGATMIKKYLSLTKLSPELQMKIASGEAKATNVLSVLAEVESNPMCQSIARPLKKSKTQKARRMTSHVKRYSQMQSPSRACSR